MDARGVRPDGRFSMDKWDGYGAARRRLYSRLQSVGTPNPVVLSGDVHVHFATELHMEPLEPASPTVGVEFTNSSISSNGDGSEVASWWPRVQGDNPHIKFHNSQRGYISCTATRKVMRADFKVVDRVSVPDEPVHLAGTFVVEAGRAELHRD